MSKSNDSGAKKFDIVDELREYAANPGYSHNDYADTMRQAAKTIEGLRAAIYHFNAMAEPLAATTNDSGLNLDHLEALARGVKSAVGYGDYSDALREMYDALDPDTVLGLIARRAAPVSAPTAGDARFDWMKAERIRDEDHVDEALRNFSEDPTGDNATGIIQAALTVWTADAIAHQPAQEQAEPQLLNWTAPKPPTEGSHPYDHVTAQTPFGEILITWKSWKDYPSYCVDTHPIPDYFYAGDSLDEAKKKAEQDYFNAITAQQEPVAAPGDAGITASPDLKKRMSDALKVTLWLYRRLPGAYGRPPFVDAALLEMAKIAGIDAKGSIAERAAQLDGGQEGSESNG